MAKAVIIKKYENRRLYDTTNSRYVNLDEVAQMLQRGENVQVVDAATGEDITRLILTQIIVEHAKTTDSTFPLDVLRQMVVATGRVGQEETLNYMKAMLDFYQNSFRMIAPAVSPFMSGRPSENRSAQTAYAPAAKREADDRDSEPEVTTNADEVKEMKRRLAELENVVSRITLKAAPRKKKPRNAR
jgi:polyhydroxyalkanoate synthesis repressor PhaR